ncbi:hypothetical protein J6590_052607, partial [Homalodisca vitripennis]
NGTRDSSVAGPTYCLQHMDYRTTTVRAYYLMLYTTAHRREGQVQRQARAGRVGPGNGQRVQVCSEEITNLTRRLGSSLDSADVIAYFHLNPSAS